MKAYLVARRRSLLALFVITLLVLLANGPYLIRVVHADPRFVLSGTEYGTSRILPGTPTADINEGVTAQALGHQAFESWIHGRVPWWNPYEGLGTPLAAEMESAAFYPPAVLLLLPGSVVWLRLALELVSGWATFGVMTRLGCGSLPAFIAGTAFALNDTFALFQHAPIYPIPLLPLALLGVERVTRGARGGILLTALALGASFYAGFPETAYCDGLVVVGWAVWRLGAIRPGMLAVRRAGALAVAGLASVVLMLPLLLPFENYVGYGDLGVHGGNLNPISMPRVGAAATLLPYVYGPINAFNGNDPRAAEPLANWWAMVGGGTVTTVALLGVAGLFGRRLLILRLGLGLLIVFCVTRNFGVPVIGHALDRIPGMSRVPAYRYMSPAWEFALAVLAGLAVQDAVERRSLVRRAAPPLIALMVIGLLIALSGSEALHFIAGDRGDLRALYRSAHYQIAWSSAMAVGAALALCLTWRLIRATLLGTVVAVDCCSLVLLPSLSAGRGGHLDGQLVSYLQSHVGDQRAFGIDNALYANYGSYWGIPELDIDDVPLPKTFSSLITQQLSPNAITFLFIGVRLRADISISQDLLDRSAAYAQAAVKYVVAPAGDPTVAGHPDLYRGVYSDAHFQVYELLGAMPLETAPGCRLSSETIDSVTADCLRPSALERREQSFPGWRATVDGHPESVRTVDTAFQSVPLPAGRHRIDFVYSPPGGLPASAAALATLVLLGAGTIRPVARGRHFPGAGPLAGVGPPAGDGVGPERPRDRPVP